MTANDIKLLARCLRSSRPVQIYSNHMARTQWYADVSAIAEMLKRERPRYFNAERASTFFDDCGVPN